MRKVLCILLLCVVSAAAQVTLSGTIVNQASVPMAGLVVKLAKAGAADTTDRSGAFSLALGSTMVTAGGSLTVSPLAQIRGQNLVVRVESAREPLHVALYDSRGALVRTLYHGLPAHGQTQIALGDAGKLASAMLFLTVKHGPRVDRMQLARVGGGQLVLVTQANVASPGLARSLVVVDSLRVARRGTVEHVVPVESYAGRLSLTLDFIPYEAVEIAVKEAGRGPLEVGKDLTVDPYALSRYVPEGSAWCSEFYCWALKAGGYPLTGGRPYSWMIAGNTGLRSWFQQRARFVTRSDPYWNTAVPRPGDFVRYDNAAGGHTGMVRSVQGTTLYTVEGNVSNKVALRTISNWRNVSSIDGIGLRSGYLGSTL